MLHTPAGTQMMCGDTCRAYGTPTNKVKWRGTSHRPLCCLTGNLTHSDTRGLFSFSPRCKQISRRLPLLQGLRALHNSPCCHLSQPMKWFIELLTPKTHRLPPALAILNAAFETWVLEIEVIPLSFTNHLQLWRHQNQISAFPDLWLTCYSGGAAKIWSENMAFHLFCHTDAVNQFGFNMKLISGYADDSRNTSIRYSICSVGPWLLPGQRQTNWNPSLLGCYWEFQASHRRCVVAMF